jgi:alpha-tubulin suppressor-like RCC1 family protein
MGRPRAAGSNPSGQLGIGTNADQFIFGAVFPLNEFNMRPTLAVAAGSQHSLALTVDGSIWAWGGNNAGQLGDGTTTDQVWPVQVQRVVGMAGDEPILEILHSVIAISAGDRHSLALLADGTVLAWGANTNGELGDGTTTKRTTPVVVSGPSGRGALGNIIAIAAGTHYSLALKADGTVWAWGRNGQGRLGDGTTTDRHLPVQAKVTRITGIAAGASHSLAIAGDGTVRAWGRNHKGQLGDNTVTDRPSPVWVKGSGGVGALTGVTAVAVGKGGFSLALHGDGTVSAWGSNSKRTLGDGTTFTRKTPVQVHGVLGQGVLTGVVAISAGAEHCMAIQDSHVVAWGWNNGGRLGTGDTVDPALPTLVGISISTGVIAIAAGLLHSLAVQVTCTIATWGNNAEGELGTDAVKSSAVALTPFQPASAEVFNMIAPAGGLGHSLAVKPGSPTSGQNAPQFVSHVMAWGANSNGQLGDGTDKSRAFAFPPDGLPSPIKAVAAGWQHSLALSTDGHVFAWGANGAGQIGDGTKQKALKPVTVKGPGGDGLLSQVVAIAAGQSHSMALRADGTVWAWGANGAGQLGDNTTNDRALPAIVPGSFMKAIAAGSLHSLMLRADGTVWACGKGNRGQLGSSLPVDSLKPVQVKGLASGNMKKMIAAGHEHSLALRADGSVWAFGANDRGQIGDDATTDRLVPVQVQSQEWESGAIKNLASVVAIAAGGRYSLALDAAGIVPPDGGVVRCWGANDVGQLGDSTTKDRAHAVNVQLEAGGALRGVSAIAAGGAHSLAVAPDDLPR